MKSIQECVIEAAAVCGVSTDDVMSTSRAEQICKARRMAWRMAYDEGHTVAQIAGATNRFVGTVYHGLGMTGRVKSERVRERLAEGGFPKRAIEKLPEMHGPGLRKAEALRERVLNDSLLLLIGPRGPGKTQMSTWWADQRGKAGLSPGRYVKMMDLLLELKSTWNGGGTEQKVIDRYRRVPFLVIDEVQERPAKDWDHPILVNLLDRRYDERVCTILIGNLSKEKAEENLGDSIWQRLTETGGVVSCDWGSYR